ncbi:MAG: hypothetical protein MMC33_010406 [Icmadophila ericetorum]|nr:hypothetical protein [Icmadophila ericetorum]
MASPDGRGPGYQGVQSLLASGEHRRSVSVDRSSSRGVSPHSMPVSREHSPSREDGNFGGRGKGYQATPDGPPRHHSVEPEHRDSDGGFGGRGPGYQATPDGPPRHHSAEPEHEHSEGGFGGRGPGYQLVATAPPHHHKAEPEHAQPGSGIGGRGPGYQDTPDGPPRHRLATPEHEHPDGGFGGRGPGYHLVGNTRKASEAFTPQPSPMVKAQRLGFSSNAKVPDLHLSAPLHTPPQTNLVSPDARGHGFQLKLATTPTVMATAADNTTPSPTGRGPGYNGSPAPATLMAIADAPASPNGRGPGCQATPPPTTLMATADDTTPSPTGRGPGYQGEPEPATLIAAVAPEGRGPGYNLMGPDARGKGYQLAESKASEPTKPTPTPTPTYSSAIDDFHANLSKQNSLLSEINVS